MDFHNEPESKRQATEMKHVGFPVKISIQAQQSVKKGILSVFGSIKESILIDFLEKKSANISPCQLLRQNSPFLLKDTRVYYIYINKFCSSI